jgi:hypothetical protein
LIGQNKLRESIAAGIGVYLPVFGAKKWPKYAKGLLSLCEDVDRGADATREGILYEWLASYLDQHPPHKTLQDADEGREPFLDGGAVLIFTAGLLRWLKVHVNEQISRNDLTADLRVFGAHPEIHDLEVNGKPTTRSAWRLPDKNWPVPKAPTASAP